MTRGVRVPRSLGFRSQGTRNPLKNRFCAFLGTLMSEYNLCSILEQVTTGSRVPKNGEPAPTGFPGSRVPRNGEPARIRRPVSFKGRVPKIGNPEPETDTPKYDYADFIISFPKDFFPVECRDHFVNH